jgi:hypothetical protein
LGILEAGRRIWLTVVARVSGVAKLFCEEFGDVPLPVEAGGPCFFLYTATFPLVPTCLFVVFLEALEKSHRDAT